MACYGYGFTVGKPDEGDDGGPAKKQPKWLKFIFKVTVLCAGGGGGCPFVAHRIGLEYKLCERGLKALREVGAMLVLVLSVFLEVQQASPEKIVGERSAGTHHARPTARRRHNYTARVCNT